MTKQIQKRIGAALCAALLLSLFSACGASRAPALREGHGLRAVVLYCGEHADGSWQDTLSLLSQSLLLDFQVTAADADAGLDLSGADVLYPDESLLEHEDRDAVVSAVTAFADGGGAVFLTNGFYDFFPKEFIGARKFVRLEGCPSEPEYPQVRDDYAAMQGVISDFASLYPSFPDYETLAQQDYGWGVKPSTAAVLATWNGAALYTLNEYGGGLVFFASRLLPNLSSITGCSLESRSEEQTTLNNTTMSCNQLLLSEFAACVSKRLYGYALYRVFGSYGRPCMTWELHFEEITGFANGSGMEFGELCREYSQVPSYSLVRNTYRWFLRAESVSYLLGQSADSLRYVMDWNEGVYSSGTHVAAGGRWLSLGELENSGSYYADDPSLTERAYPCVCDLDGDGVTDLLCGAADGLFHFYRGTGFTDRLTTEADAPLTDAAGTPLSVSGDSAPVLTDLDGDGTADLLSGCADGKLYWFSGGGDGTFTPRGVWLETGLATQSLPDCGDLNGDGYTDLAVGSDEGRLLVWYGTAAGPGGGAGTEIPVFGVEGDWISPRIRDLDGDGTADLAVGTFDGYVARLIGDGKGSFAGAGFLELDEMNYKGNYNAKFGNNCVPCFADLNGDGKTDLLCGNLEYGMAYPIDSPYFPDRTGLAESLKYIEDNGFYLGMHFLTTQYSSQTREDEELDAHWKALRAYGAAGTRIGANQHTWYTSVAAPAQTFLSLWDHGLLWDSGYTPADNPSHYPQASAENVISLPFFLTRDGEKTILLQNCSTLLYTDEAWTDISARYGMPMCLYYHCDFTHGNEDAARKNLETAEAFRRKHGYTFVMEDQMMLAVAAAYNLTADVAPETGGAFGLTITPGAESAGGALYDGNYQSSCGARLSLGEALAGKTVTTDAAVWYQDGNELYFGLNTAVHIGEADAPRTGAHLTSVNVAARVSADEKGATVQFLDGGMMQVTVSGGASAVTEGWTRTETDAGTMITKYGEASTLVLTYGE